MGTHQKKNNKISYSAEELREIPFIFKKLKVDGIFCILEQNMHSNRELKGIVAMVDSNLLYSLCNLIDIICSIGK